MPDAGSPVSEKNSSRQLGELRQKPLLSMLYVLLCSGGYQTRRVWALGLFFPRERRKALAADHQNIQVRPRDWLTPVALVILREESSYGYGLMEQKCLCKSEWETSEGGPARRMYYITEPGEWYLAAWAEGCDRYQTIMDCFFQAYAS